MKCFSTNLMVTVKGFELQGVGLHILLINLALTWSLVIGLQILASTEKVNILNLIIQAFIFFP